MSLLDRAINFATKAYNYVVGNDDEPKTAQKNGKTHSVSNAQQTGNTTNPQAKRINSTMNEKGDTVGTVGDTLERTTTSQNKSKSVQKTKNIPMQEKIKFSKNKSDKNNNTPVVNGTIDKVLTNINNKCKKFGISYQEAKKTILSQMQFSLDEFKQLSPDEQLAVLYSIDGALGLYIIDKGKREVHPKVDRAALIGQTARNIIEAKENGGINNVNEFKEGTGDVLKELDGKINSKTTDEQYAQILEETRRAFKASLELKREVAIRKCNGDQAKIDEVNRQYDARLKAFEAQRQTEFAAAVGPEKAKHSVYLRSGKYFADAHAVALSVYTGENRTIVADSFTHDFEINAKRRYYECGDNISSEEYGKAIAYAAQYMSEQALSQFEKDAYDFRVKVENGEIDAPYMTQEDFQVESVSVAVGIVNNTNISDDCKKSLLSKWHALVSNFNDYEQILRKVVPYIRHFDDNSVKVLKILNDSKIVNNTSALNIIKQIGNKKASRQELEQALFSMGYERAKKCLTQNSEKDFVEAILTNPNLKQYKNHILSYIKTLTVEDLSFIMGDCCSEMFNFVLRNISPDKAGRLFDLTKKEKGYNTRKSGEKIIEESQKNAAV